MSLLRCVLVIIALCLASTVVARDADICFLVVKHWGTVRVNDVDRDTTMTGEGACAESVGPRGFVTCARGSRALLFLGDRWATVSGDTVVMGEMNCQGGRTQLFRDLADDYRTAQTTSMARWRGPKDKPWVGWPDAVHPASARGLAVVIDSPEAVNYQIALAGESGDSLWSANGFGTRAEIPNSVLTQIQNRSPVVRPVVVLTANVNLGISESHRVVLLSSVEEGALARELDRCTRDDGPAASLCRAATYRKFGQYLEVARIYEKLYSAVGDTTLRNIAAGYYAEINLWHEVDRMRRSEQ